MMSGSTLGGARRQQQHPPPVGFRDALASLGTPQFHAMTTPGVLECSREEQLVQTVAFPNHGYKWIAAAESDAAHTAESDLMSQGYPMAFHPADSPAGGREGSEGTVCLG